MNKHLFLLTTVVKDLKARRRLDAYSVCHWPLHHTACEPGDAEAYVAMLDGHDNLPNGVKVFCYAYQGMRLRRRYAGANVTGPYLINDADEVFSRDTLEQYLNTLSDSDLNNYRC